MTRRIALSLLAVITALLVLAVVPLGLSMTERERISFRDAAASDTRSIAAAAEENLSDHKSDASARKMLAEAHERGDCAAVFDRTGHRVLGTTCPTDQSSQDAGLVRSVLAHHETRIGEDEDWLSTAVPVGDTNDAAGVTVLNRPNDPMHDRVLAMWGWLTLIGAGCLAAAVFASAGLARWVGRPLRAVDAAAQRLGEGALDVRAPADQGPPEVRRLASTFNTMAGRNEALVHGHRAVVADVSHQLRTPLAALRLRLDLLAADAEDDTAAELSGAQEEIARLSRLVDGLLAVARAEHSVPRPEPVRVDRAVEERISIWDPLANERSVDLSADCRPGLTAALGPGDLEQALDNLIANALDAVPEGGRVRITGTLRDGTVRIRVTDNGPGMSAAIRATAFRRFGNPEATGTGLGLAIVHRLVTSNGGSAALEETPGGGLTVQLDVPAARRGHVSRAASPDRPRQDGN